MNSTMPGSYRPDNRDDSEPMQKLGEAIQNSFNIKGTASSILAFLSLPCELRNLIYDALFSEATLIIEKSQRADQKQAIGSWKLFRENWHVNILSTCKTVRFEANYILQKNCIECKVGAAARCEEWQMFAKTMDRLPFEKCMNVKVLSLSSAIPVRHIMKRFEALREVQIQHILLRHGYEGDAFETWKGQNFDGEVIALMRREMQTGSPFGHWLMTMLEPLLEQKPHLRVTSKGWYMNDTRERSIDVVSNIMSSTVGIAIDVWQEVVFDVRAWSVASVRRFRFVKICGQADHPMLTSRYRLEPVN